MIALRDAFAAGEEPRQQPCLTSTSAKIAKILVLAGRTTFRSFGRRRDLRMTGVMFLN
jgi:hypothetical protein